eukprot:TRINITY_DN4785_c0_g1_i2.p1 TRINITY_DN4785_c0_g1~~TRINITY_DN4785_c0_g1_i2.p1  ORF type:complete len:503 (-),score=154.40 TRINITY_DN4785_c0_g1_i2:22-1530(-)
MMDYCAVGSVEDLMVANQRTLTEKQIAAVCLASLKGLDYLHGTCEIIHRDIKAANILLTEQGQIKLADFGVSQPLTTALESEDAIIGTPLFVSPEVVKDKLYSYKQDIWALGITAIEMYDGYPPYIEMNSVRAMYSIPHRASPTVKEPSQCSQGFLEFVAKCLVKDHTQRPGAREFFKDSWLVEFMLSGERDQLKGSIASALQQRAVTQKEETKEPMMTYRDVRRESRTGSGGIYGTSVVTGTLEIKSDEEDLPGTSEIRHMEGTSVIGEESEDEVPQFISLLNIAHPPALLKIDHTEPPPLQIPGKPEMRSIGTQTDPVRITAIPIQKLSQLEKQKSFKQQRNPAAPSRSPKKKAIVDRNAPLASSSDPIPITASASMGNVKSKMSSSLSKSPPVQLRSKSKTPPPPVKRHVTSPRVPTVNVSPGEGEITLGKIATLNNGKRGIIRYYGKVLDQPVPWVGIELNKPEGKNNGSLQGKTYFVCRDNYGLFVPLNRVVRVSNR